MNRRANLRIKGLVQGVFFRQSAKVQAERLGLSGWVRNLPDGDVEAVAEGPTEALESFTAWCRQGPRAAQVTEVQVAMGRATGEFDGFRVER